MGIKNTDSKTLESLAQAFASLAQAKAEYKALANVYQCEAKQSAAIRRGLPLNTFYDMEYSQWAVIRDSDLSELDSMSASIRQVEKYHGLTPGALSAVPFNQWYSLWDKYQEGK